MSAKQTLEPIVSILSRVVAASHRRLTERRIARFSTHLLEDMGFARDWDGSVYRPEDRS